MSVDAWNQKHFLTFSDKLIKLQFKKMENYKVFVKIYEDKVDGSDDTRM